MAIDYSKGMRPNLYEIMQGGGGGGGYVLPPATNETLGGVIIGEGVDVDENGTISVTAPAPADTYTKAEIDAQQAEQDSNIADNAAAIQTEATAREDADTTLQNNIDTVASNLETETAERIAGQVLHPATYQNLGSVIVGGGLNITNDGVLSSTASDLSFEFYPNDEPPNATIIKDGAETIGMTFNENDVNLWFSDGYDSASKTIPINDYQFEQISGSVDDVSIAENGRKLVEIVFPDFPANKIIYAFKTIKIANATNNGTGFEKCVIQDFATTGGSTKAQIPIVNVANSAAKIKVSATCLIGHSI